MNYGTRLSIREELLPSWLFVKKKKLLHEMGKGYGVKFTRESTRDPRGPRRTEKFFSDIVLSIWYSYKFRR